MLLIPRTDPRLRRLSKEAREGLDYAYQLAQNAAERKALALEGLAPPPLTIAELARDDDTSATVIHRRLSTLRIELFGKDLSDSACYYRVRRDLEQGDPARRPCAEPGCPRPLPRYPTARRHYCEFHGQSHGRVARHRLARRKEPARRLVEGSTEPEE